jgi:glycosyltransferase involved in cell wall biosynthesis
MSAEHATPRDIDIEPFVSVVIPTRNRADLLPDAIASLVQQDYPKDRFEIIVVDDGSDDTTRSAMLSLSGEDGRPPILLFRQAPRNPNAARNRGAEMARGSLVAFVDDDELAPDGWLSTLVDAALRHPEAACVGGPYRVRFDGRPPRLCTGCWPGEGWFDLGGKEEVVSDVPGGNMLIRREVFENIGQFDDRLRGYGEETEWMWRARGRGMNVLYVPDAWVWHRRTADRARLRRRTSKAFSVGREMVAFFSCVGAPFDSPKWRLANVPRFLAHAARRRCTGGLTDAATAIGYALQARRERRGRAGQRRRGSGESLESE